MNPIGCGIEVSRGCGAAAKGSAEETWQRRKRRRDGGCVEGVGGSRVTSVTKAAQPLLSFSSSSSTSAAASTSDPKLCPSRVYHNLYLSCALCQFPVASFNQVSSVSSLASAILTAFVISIGQTERPHLKRRRVIFRVSISCCSVLVF